MNATQIQQAVLHYLTATNCHLLDVSPEQVTVKLSPEADKALTNRPYYWGFIERTNTQPETLSYTFIFDPEYMQHTQSGQLDVNSGFRTIHVTFGSTMFEKILQEIISRGQYVCLYEHTEQDSEYPLNTAAYTSWLVVNYKLELVCEMKREELHSLGISLSTGEIAEQFHTYVAGKSLTPKMPAHTHLRETISLQRAKLELDRYMRRIIDDMDHHWADTAHERMREELKRVDDYYQERLQLADDDTKTEIEAQYNNRLSEIEWQYKPRIMAAPFQCGMFHLLDPRH